jgi:UDP-N-acetylmuramyl pentapeptide synthase
MFNVVQKNVRMTVNVGNIFFLTHGVAALYYSVDARAAAAHAAATLWSLCVDMDHIKPMVAQDSTLRALIKQVEAAPRFSMRVDGSQLSN